jgi:hypothetical protein
MACDMKDETGCENYTKLKQRYWVIVSKKNWSNSIHLNLNIKMKTQGLKLPYFISISSKKAY